MLSHQLLHNNFQFGGADPFIQDGRVDSSLYSPWRIPLSPIIPRIEAHTQLIALQSHQTRLQTPNLSLHPSSLLVIIILSVLFCCLLQVSWDRSSSVSTEAHKQCTHNYWKTANTSIYSNRNFQR